MPKVKNLLSSCLRTFVNEFDEDIFKTDETVLLCKKNCDIKDVSIKKLPNQKRITHDKHKQEIQQNKEITRPVIQN